MQEYSPRYGALYRSHRHGFYAIIRLMNGIGGSQEEERKKKEKKKDK
jgi:hypothetical protein